MIFVVEGDIGVFRVWVVFDRGFVFSMSGVFFEMLVSGFVEVGFLFVGERVFRFEGNKSSVKGFGVGVGEVGGSLFRFW